MTVSANYSSPVMVNGFECKNCTDVDYAKKHIDPAHPKDGPYGVDAKDKLNAKTNDPRSPSVTFGGRLADLAASNTASSAAQTSSGLGVRVDVSV